MVDQLPEVSEDAVQRAAEVMLRQYDRRYSSGHLTWRDFADDAREILTVALAPPPGELEPAERPAFEGEVPGGCELVAVPDPNWRLVSGKRCRRQEAFHRVCVNPAVAEFCRAHGHSLVGVLPGAHVWPVGRERPGHALDAARERPQPSRGVRGYPVIPYGRRR
jgi:hypothetical protein